MEAKIDIRKFRKKYNLTRVQLADIMGVSQHTVAAWELDRYTPSGPAFKFIEHLEKLNSMIGKESDEHSK